MNGKEKSRLQNILQKIRDPQTTLEEIKSLCDSRDIEFFKTYSSEEEKNKEAEIRELGGVIFFESLGRFFFYFSKKYGEFGKIRNLVEKEQLSYQELELVE